MKIVIRKGPVSLELTVDPNMPISDLKTLIYDSIPIPQDKQKLSCIVSGSIVINN